MTRIGTNSTLRPAARKAIRVSDSTSKCSVWSGRAAQVCRWMRRKPDCVSGNVRRAHCDSFPLIHRFTCRRSQGILHASFMRLPITSKAPVSSAHRTSAGKSSGACWPSPSSVTAHSKPCFRACAKPVLSAVPLPWLRSCWITTAPATLARRAVSSVEPSSTTSTNGSCRRKAATRVAMLAASLKHGTTAAQLVGSGTPKV